MIAKLARADADPLGESRSLVNARLQFHGDLENFFPMIIPELFDSANENVKV